MNTNSSIIWMNVTTSANWHRPPVGIVRVERSLCTELEKLYGENFKQCVWQRDKFVEWYSKVETEKCGDFKQGPTLENDQSNDIKSLLVFPLLPKRQALKAIGQGLFSLMPNKIRPHLNRVLLAIRPKIVRLLTNGWLASVFSSGRINIFTTSSSHSENQNRHENAGDLFSPGDVLISIGLDWDYTYYKEFYYFRKIRKIKVVTCCYDLIPVIYPQYCVSNVAKKFTSYFLDIAEGSDLVLCISKQSERDLLNLLDETGGAIPPTHVFPLGDNVPITDTGLISQAVRELCKEDFILYISTIERRKNHEVLYRAYHLLCSKGKRNELPKLLFVGMQGWGVTDLMNDIDLDPLIRGLIVRLNHVSDSELRMLYEAAKFCVFPSFYEGWGLPVGEALLMGKAVLASNRGSIPEVGGDLVRYVDPWNPHAWADELFRMSTDKDWRIKWEDNIKHKFHSRTWAKAAISVKNAID